MGMVWLDSVESDELLYPILVTGRRIIPDSEGAGRFRGAPGTYVEFEPLGTDVEAMYASDGCVHPAAGVRGGLDGARAAQFKRMPNGELESLGPMGPVRLAPGERVISIGAGGGGYGPPFERDPARVANDVAEGWTSRKRADEIYQVVLADDGSVDQVATAVRRSNTMPATG